MADDIDFGEGPVALPDGRVAFTEVGGQRISVAEGRTRRPIAKVPGAPNGMARGPDGALYVANNGGIGPDRNHDLWTADDALDGCIQRVGLDGEVSDFVAGLPGAHPHRPNDLCFGPGGSLYFTDSGNWEVFFTEETDFRSSPPGYRHGALYLRAADGEVVRLADVSDFPNGLAVTPDGEHLVVAQTVLLRLVSFPLRADGTVGEPELYCQLPEPVLPDGMCFTEDGTLYVCGAVGDAIAVIGPDRQLVDVLETGVHSDPTNVCLTEGTLWITHGTGRRLATLEVDARPLPLFGAGRD
ncbi:SMP-30/gluconolactonase/LRE family protein [Pseudonocardia sp. EC080619-01]|uniref:SMP-30/gluconolactonase/LRE family protein n=1 Tax=Pseudonocardia sp. EC080619-01 TaxID=1096856 RepID=UPI00143B7593|nr:SMP-30/gluconolactonase/LRE family protein [Pseudonocardia sp. EC080619-01]